MVTIKRRFTMLYYGRRKKKKKERDRGQKRKRIHYLKFRGVSSRKWKNIEETVAHTNTAITRNDEKPPPPYDYVMGRKTIRGKRKTTEDDRHSDREVSSALLIIWKCRSSIIKMDRFALMLVPTIETTFSDCFNHRRFLFLFHLIWCIIYQRSSSLQRNGVIVTV